MVLLYGLCLALLAFLLQWWDYRLMVHDISMEIYVAVIATFCTAIGVWVGLKFTRPIRENKAMAIDRSVDFDLSPREMEVLELIAQGLSNQEIAEKLFISIHTVKTHSSNLFSKLDVKRRVQAVNKARQIGLLSAHTSV